MNLARMRIDAGICSPIKVFIQPASGTWTYTYHLPEDRLRISTVPNIRRGQMHGQCQELTVDIHVDHTPSVRIQLLLQQERG